ncbi:hypothetical protein ACQUWM_12285 [Marinobacter sp. DUT-3]|uniref:hypothetical protein n=1 Tax=Marinobacter sp. DUT-3 TaxID=3412036 RepID=UPI003D1729AF
MSKFYLNLLTESGSVVQAVIDLANLPKECNRNIVDHPFKQGVDLIDYLRDDEKHSVNLINNIRNDYLSDDEHRFISNVASFWENLPPSAEEKCGVVAITPSQGDFLRTSEEVAEEMAEGMSKIGSN